MNYYVYWFTEGGESFGIFECDTLDDVKEFLDHEELEGYVLIKGDLIQKKGVDDEKVH